jgi:hypothetical protein
MAAPLLGGILVKLTNCVKMAEGGGIGPRSSKGTAAYRAAPAAKQVALRSGNKERSPWPLSVLPSKKSPARAFVLSPNPTVSYPDGGAIAILSIIRHTSPSDYIANFLDVD